MHAIRIPDECIERWNGTHFASSLMPNGNMSVVRHGTADLLLLTKTFLAWAGSSIPKAEIVAVYVSGERDSFEIRGTDDDLMLMRMRWYKDRPVPVMEELPQHLYVTAPYAYHAETISIPTHYQRVS